MGEDRPAPKREAARATLRGLEVDAMCRMTRLSLVLALAGCPGLAFAQTTYDPAIAYTQAQGKTTNLYVANADGSRAVKVASGTNINAIDFAPGGGRVAYSSSDGLRVVSFSASTSGVAVTGNSLLVAGSGVYGPDFSADGARILYHHSGAYRAVPSGGGAPTLLYTAFSGGFSQRWLRPAEMGNAFAFLVPVPHGPNVPVDYEIRIVLLDAQDQVVAVSTAVSTASQAFKAIEDFDTARTRNALVLAANFPTTARLLDYDIGTMQVGDLGAGGARVHYTADDSALVYREQVKGGSFITRLQLGSGALTRLTAKGDYGVVDTRP